MNLEEILDQGRVALVGASANPEKYGFKIFKFLKENSVDVTPINPKKLDIDGVKCISKISDLEFIPDLVVLVVPPSVSENISEECVSMGVKNVWMQPGSQPEKAVEFLENSEIDVIYDKCIMVESKK